jgi:signal transduction histidine kinase
LTVSLFLLAVVPSMTLAAVMTAWLVAARCRRQARAHAGEQQAFAERERRYVAAALSAEIAHELTSCLLFLRDLVTLDALEEADRAVARHEVGRLERILGRLRRVRLSDEGPVPVNLRSAVERALRRVGLVGDGRMTLEVPPPLTVVAGVAGLELLLVCLLRNATAAAAAGMITVRALERADGTWLEIEDQGPGLAPAVREEVFRPLATLERGATGLGMPVALRVARDHDWRISTVRERERTVFRVQMPPPAAAGKRPSGVFQVRAAS